MEGRMMRGADGYNEALFGTIRLEASFPPIICCDLSGFGLTKP